MFPVFPVAGTSTSTSMKSGDIRNLSRPPPRPSWFDMRHFAGSTQQQFLAVRSNGCTVGVALTSRTDVNGPEVAIDFLVVDKAFHWRGVGKALTRHVIDTADREACIRC